MFFEAGNSEFLCVLSYDSYDWCCVLSDEGGSLFKPYLFKMDEIEGFKYRAKVSVRAVNLLLIEQAWDACAFASSRIVRTP